MLEKNNVFVLLQYIRVSNKAKRSNHLRAAICVQVANRFELVTFSVSSSNKFAKGRTSRNADVNAIWDNYVDSSIVAK